MTFPIYVQKHAFALLAAAGLTVFAAASGVAEAADGDRATSDVMSRGLVFPYEGSLAMDGQPMTGEVTLRFELWDHPTDSEPENLRYVETQEGVDLYSGRFFVGLGTGTNTSGSIDAALLDGDRMFLSLAIQDGTNTLVPLEGRQVIEAVPYAAWTGHAADMSVAEDVTVEGDLSATGGELQSAAMNIFGPISAPSIASTDGNVISAGNISTDRLISAGGNAIVEGNVSGGSPGNVSGDTVTAIGEMRAGSAFLEDGRVTAATLEVQSTVELGYFAITNSINNSVAITNAQRLGFIFFDDAANPGLEISEGDLNVPNGEITTDGDLSAESNSHGTCRWNPTWTLRDGTTSDSSANRQSCSSGRFAAGIDFTHRSRQDGTHQEYYRLYCCEL